MVRAFILIALVMGFQFRALATEMLLTSKIVSIEDSQSQSRVIRKGGSVKAKVGVVIAVKGTSAFEIKKWISENVPETIQGTLEARRPSSDRLVASVSEQFTANRNLIKCKQAKSGSGQICQIQYVNQNNNYVEVPTTGTGMYALTLRLREPNTVATLVMMNGKAMEYSVEGGVSRAFASFAGLPEN